MKRQLLHTPQGVRDIYGMECARKLALQDRLHRKLAAYGYHDIETPTFEFFDVFGSDIGTIPSRELFKFFDRDGNTLVLRPDFTPSVVRAAAKFYMEEPGPIRMCYQGSAFINNLNYQGRLKENTHMGAELLGDGSADADAEMIALIVELMLESGLREFQVSVGQVEFFKGLLEEAGIDEETEEKLRELIVNKNHFGIEELLEGLDMEEAHRRAFVRMPELFGGPEVLDEAWEAAANPLSRQAVERLREVYQVLELYGLQDYVSFDFGMINRYRYYSGVIFRAYTYGTGEPVVKGGRYDSLMAKFGKACAATGFVVVVNQLLAALDRQKIPVPAGKGALLLLYPEELRAQAVCLAKELRARGTAVELARMADGDRADAHLSYAKINGHRFLARMQGEDRIALCRLDGGENRLLSPRQLLEEEL